MLGFLTRSKIVGLVLFAVVFTPLLGSADGLPVESWWLRGIIPLLACAYTWVRHGLIGMITILLTIFALMTPVTSNTNAFYFQYGLLGVALVAFATLWTFRGSLRDRNSAPRLSRVR